MFKIVKTVLGLAAGMVLVQQAGAFSLWGPTESWQVTTLDYVDRHLLYGEFELGGTKNLGEGSRINCPIITYAYDSTFLSYFGASGVKAVDSAMTLLNNLPSASSASPGLTEFITQGNQQINYSAQAMSLEDLKSTVLGLMMERMGLIGETHVFDLRERAPDTGTCVFDYLTILRNFDPVTWEPTPYVNGYQYFYSIEDLCAIGDSVADAVELTPATAPYYTAVATKEAQLPGGYYLGLTRDDFGGLRYLYRHNNYNYEQLEPDSFAGGFGGQSAWSPVTGFLTNSVGSNVAGVFGGVEKIRFVKVAYDSLVGINFTPLTFNYTIPYVTNSTLQSLQVTRFVTAPDIIFAAADISGVGTPAVITYNAYSRSTPAFITANLTPPGGGVTPSVIPPQATITFNKVGALFLNSSPEVDQGTAFYPGFIWGSFDGSTNAPVVFPTGTSLAEIEQQVLNGGTTVPNNVYVPALSTILTNGTGAIAP